MLLATPAVGATEAERCREILQGRVKTCADDCVAKAKAAVSPEIRDRVLGYGCWNNCMKLEMFNGNTCPRD